VQREIERRGIPTVSMSVARDVSEQVRPPRVVFAPFMMGHHFGVPFHRALQRRMIGEALAHLVEAKVSGEVRVVPITWAEARREGRAIEESTRESPR
jgi:hypothetical protein